jgi:hypothetical protein
MSEDEFKQYIMSMLTEKMISLITESSISLLTKTPRHDKDATDYELSFVVMNPDKFKEIVHVLSRKDYKIIDINGEVISLKDLIL